MAHGYFYWVCLQAYEVSIWWRGIDNVSVLSAWPDDPRCGELRVLTGLLASQPGVRRTEMPMRPVMFLRLFGVCIEGLLNAPLQLELQL